VREHVLGCRHRVGSPVAPQDVEHVQPLLVSAEQLGRDVDAIAGEQLPQV